MPIPGTKRVEYLEQNVGALDVVLTEDELARLDSWPTGWPDPLSELARARRDRRDQGAAHSAKG